MIYDQEVSRIQDNYVFLLYKNVCIQLLACILRLPILETQYHALTFLSITVQKNKLRLQISSATNIKWNSFSELPQLGSMFETLEIFIMENAACKERFCAEDELPVIEEKMNNLVVLLHCQKLYAKQYWDNDKRRVQASFVHFFIIFKQYILAIIPKDCPNIIQASNANRLPTNLIQLEKLVNAVLKLIEPIHNYLFLPSFQQEQQVTQQILFNFSQFLQKLPYLNKNELSEIPKLMKFICIYNTFEAQCNSVKQFKQNRKKSESFQPKIKLQSPLVNKVAKYDSKSDILMNNEFLKKSTWLSNNNSNKKPSQDEKCLESKFSFFKFNRNLRKNSSATQKKHTESAINPRSDSFLSASRLARERSATIKPKFHTLIKSRAFQKNSSSMPRLTVRKHPSLSIQQKIKQLSQQQQEQIQRANKVKKSKKDQTAVKYTKFSQKCILETGKSKGWAVIRQYINTRIVLRKFKKLLNM